MPVPKGNQTRPTAKILHWFRFGWSHKWRCSFTTVAELVPSLRFRVKAVRILQVRPSPIPGATLTCADLGLKLPFKPWHLNARLQYFETDGYDSRIYALKMMFPWQVRFLHSMTGAFLYYLVYVYRLTVDFQVAAKFSQLWKPGREQVDRALKPFQGDPSVRAPDPGQPATSEEKPGKGNSAFF